MILKDVFEWPACRLPTHQYINTGNKGIIGKTIVVQGYEELTETTLTLTFHIATGTLEEIKAKS